MNARILDIVVPDLPEPGSPQEYQRARVNAAKMALRYAKAMGAKRQPVDVVYELTEMLDHLGLWPPDHPRVQVAPQRTKALVKRQPQIRRAARDLLPRAPIGEVGHDEHEPAEPGHAEQQPGQHHQ